MLYHNFCEGTARKLVEFVLGSTAINYVIRGLNEITGRSGVRGKFTTKSSLKMSCSQMNADHLYIRKNACVLAPK